MNWSSVTSNIYTMVLSKDWDELGATLGPGDSLYHVSEISEM